MVKAGFERRARWHDDTLWLEGEPISEANEDTADAPSLWEAELAAMSDDEMISELEASRNVCLND